jgi:hypothetical protein
VKKDGDAKTSSFQIRREWLLPIDDVSAEMRDQNESKSKVLVIEADLSCRSDCEIGEKYFDLNPHDAVNSLKMISFLCHTQSILGPKDLIRLVALGNGSKLMKTLGGGTISLRDFMEQNGCYRFLDTKELMSRAVAQWIEAKGKMMEGNLKTVWLDVSTSRKAEYLKNIIESLGWKVRLIGEKGVLDSSSLVLVFQNSAIETMNRVKEFVCEADGANRSCAIFYNSDTELEELHACETDFDSISMAHVYDEALKTTRRSICHLENESGIMQSHYRS